MTAPQRAIEPDDEPRPGFFARHKGMLAVLAALVVLVGGAGIAWTVARDAFSGLFAVTDYPGPGGEEVLVTIPKGSSITRIGEILTEADVVASASAFVSAAAENPDASTIQAGTFRLRLQIPAATAVEMLLDPTNVERNSFTLREGNAVADHVKAMAEASGLPASDFEELLADPAALGLPDWGAETAEGFLFPDTYELPDPVDAASMIGVATNHFADITTELDFEAGAEAQGITPLEALTLASIIEKEVFLPEDRPKVARVIYNRLEQGMKLQLDSTIAYLAGIEGTVWTTAEQREIDSPYNTYKYEGLPPGPISSPGRAALEAAVNPAEGDWLFFVPVNLDTGETKFTSSYEEHQAAVAELQEWCKTSDKC